ncbi:MAG: SprT family zinc-dependent metalloprotease [Candidatus Woesebacteria bacterium]|jgi:predicted metal-dependent hydrolase
MWKKFLFLNSREEKIKPLDFKYQHRASLRAKNLTIKINQRGQVIVVTPKNFSKKKLNKFLREKQSWIKKKLKQIKAARTKISQQELMIFGKKYQKKVEFNQKRASGFFIKGQDIILNLINQTALEKDQLKASSDLHLKYFQKTINQKRLNRFLKNTAEKYIIPRTHQLAKKMAIRFKRISLREQKTRWGSCSSKGNLNFNWRLIHYSPEIIDYVIIHELAHRKEMNHSRKFWQLVAKYDPEYPKHRGFLKRHGVNLD